MAKKTRTRCRAARGARVRGRSGRLRPEAARRVGWSRRGSGKLRLSTPGLICKVIG
jgi:hypothetical protein